MQRTVFFLMTVLALTARAADEPKPADGDNFFERAAKVIGRDAKSVAHAAKRAGKDIGHAAADVGKDIGHAASKAGKEIGDAFKTGAQKAGTEGKETSKK